MQIIRGLHNLRSRHRGCVATIGNFDGVHLGHQQVFQHLHEKARDFNLPATVVTFEPQPMEFFSPEKAPARLTRLREKLQALKRAGIDLVVLLEFSRKLSLMSAEQFIQELLVDGLDVRHLFVGDDFRFGHARKGDINLLQQAGALHNFGVEDINTFAIDEKRVSSTLIREALSKGDLELARESLGRPYRICGRVAHGDKRGRIIGFPTANINLHRKVSPLRGVFAVEVFGLGEKARPGVANIGCRPTLGRERRYLLEVHLFNFSQQIYGAHVEVEFCQRLRDEKRFNSLDELKQQIKQDALAATEFFDLPSVANKAL